MKLRRLFREQPAGWRRTRSSWCCGRSSGAEAAGPPARRTAPRAPAGPPLPDSTPMMRRTGRHRLASHAEVGARVDGLGAGGEEVPDRAGHGRRRVERGADVDLGDAVADGRDQPLVRHSGRSRAGRAVRSARRTAASAGRGRGRRCGWSWRARCRWRRPGRRRRCLSRSPVPGRGRCGRRARARPAGPAVLASDLPLTPPRSRALGRAPSRPRRGSRRGCRRTAGGPRRITELNPAPAAWRSRSSLCTWSRCSATGTVARFGGGHGGAGQRQQPSVAELDGVLADLEDHGDPADSAPATTASMCSRVMTLNAATAERAAAAAGDQLAGGREGHVRCPSGTGPAVQGARITERVRCRGWSGSSPGRRRRRPRGAVSGRVRRAGRVLPRSQRAVARTCSASPSGAVPSIQAAVPAVVTLIGPCRYLHRRVGLGPGAEASRIFSPASWARPTAPAAPGGA